jgi:hypothetical protein
MEETRKQPGIWGCSLGSILGFLIAAIIFGLVSTGLGFSFVLMIPRSLGLIQTVSAEEVIQVEVPGESEVEFSQAGSYVILSQRPPNARYTVSMESAETGERVPLYGVEGNLSYETGGVQGRLIIDFEIQEPGLYGFSARNEGTTREQFYIAPDYSDRNQVVLALFFCIPLVTLVLGGAVIYHWQERKRRASLRQRTDKWAEWAEMQRSKKIGMQLSQSDYPSQGDSRDNYGEES